MKTKELAPWKPYRWTSCRLARLCLVTEEKCVEAWMLGLKDARKVAETLDMKPKLVFEGKWEEPWHFFFKEAELNRLSEEEEEDGEEGSSEEPRLVATQVAEEGALETPGCEERRPNQLVSNPDLTSESELDNEQSIELRLSFLSALQGEDSDDESEPNPSGPNQTNSLETDADLLPLPLTHIGADDAGREVRQKVATIVHVPGERLGVQDEGHKSTQRDS